MCLLLNRMSFLINLIKNVEANGFLVKVKLINTGVSNRDFSLDIPR